MVLAFFIYWIFNPSGASRLWYNVRTFPQRVTSWISDKTTFLDYDSYKLNLSDVWAKIKGDEDTSSVRDTDIEVEDNTKKSEEKKEDKTEDKTIQSFSGLAPQFVEVQQPTKKLDSKNNPEWYSKSDLVGIIGNYVEKNLDDDTDILVTVEYTKDVSNPDKIILETQPKSSDNCHSVSTSRVWLKNLFWWLRRSKSETVKMVSWSEETAEVKEVKYEDKADWVVNDNPVVIEWKQENVETTAVNNTSSTNAATTKKTNGLTQSEIREAEQVMWILF